MGLLSRCLHSGPALRSTTGEARCARASLLVWRILFCFVFLAEQVKPLFGLSEDQSPLSYLLVSHPSPHHGRGRRRVPGGRLEVGVGWLGGGGAQLAVSVSPFPRPVRMCIGEEGEERWEVWWRGCGSHLEEARGEGAEPKNGRANFSAVGAGEGTPS